jgi:hypothetical protein
MRRKRTSPFKGGETEDTNMMKRLIPLACAGMLMLGLVAGLAPFSLASQGTGCMPTTGTVSGLTFAQYVNSALAALISSNSGASEPATDCSGAPVKGQMWLDTSSTPSVLRQYDGNSWVALGALDQANHLWAPPVGGGSATITAAATTDICAAPSALQTISGTTTVTSFGSGCVVGVRKTLIFASATPITYHATAMILPGKRSYTAAAGDVADAIYLGAGNWRVVSITRIDGSSVTNPAIPLGTVIYGDYGTIPPKTVYGAGQAISRASYPDYLAAVTRAQTGTLTAGNNTITSVSDTSGLGAGMPLEGTGIQAGTTIASVTSNTIVMSAVATTNGAQTVTAFMTGYGAGGDSTTVGVKDCRGRTLAGRDNMLIGAAGRLTSSYFGSTANAINVAGGAEYRSLTSASQLPAHDHSVYLNDPGHSHAFRNWPDRNQALNLSGTTVNAAVNESTNQIQTSTETTGITLWSGAGGTGNQNKTASTGSGAPFASVQPTITAECVIVVLP